MPITAAIAKSYRLEILQGIHQAGDVYKIALYAAAATLNKDTTAYSATNEVPNSGTYVAGGATLQGFASALDGDVAIVDWTTDPSWTGATITARGALIYNSSRANRAVAILDFGADIASTNGTFTVALPAATADTAVIRLEPGA